jgi:hypothetical protein
MEGQIMTMFRTLVIAALLTCASIAAQAQDTWYVRAGGVRLCCRRRYH